MRRSRAARTLSSLMTDADEATSRGEPTDNDGDTSVVTTTGLTKEYGGRPIFEGVDLDIAPGAMTAVIGPNGIGKTTLVKTLLGHVDPTAGTVTYTGPAVDRPMGYLPQEPAFRPQFTVSETVAFYASLVDAAVDTEALLREVNLSEARNRRVTVTACRGWLPQAAVRPAHEPDSVPPPDVDTGSTAGETGDSRRESGELLGCRLTAGRPVVRSCVVGTPNRPDPCPRMTAQTPDRRCGQASSISSMS